MLADVHMCSVMLAGAVVWQDDCLINHGYASWGVVSDAFRYVITRTFPGPVNPEPMVHVDNAMCCYMAPSPL